MRVNATTHRDTPLSKKMIRILIVKHTSRTILLIYLIYVD